VLDPLPDESAPVHPTITDDGTLVAAVSDVDGGSGWVEYTP
jgi:hypothetical protein